MPNFENFTSEKKELPKIKDGVDFVYEQNPELTEIGTKEQYSKYLETIFPESKVKDIVWHGSQNKFESFDIEKYRSAGNFGIGIYSTPDKIFADKYRRGKEGFLYGVVVNVKDPLITSLRYKEYYGLFIFTPEIKMSEYIKNDSIINYEGLDRDKLKVLNEYLLEYAGNRNESGLPTYQEDIYSNPYIKEIVVFDNDQANILGTKKDLENFKKFVETNNESNI